MNILYCDCFSGISGDMFLAGLIDAGLPVAYLREQFCGLNLPEFHDVQVEIVSKGAVRASVLKLDFDPPPAYDSRHHHTHHRHLADIVTLIEASRLTPEVQQVALNIFQHLAEAEARVHGIPVEAVHFHEVGGVDSILDIVGAAVGLSFFAVERVYASALPLGSGTVKTEHGLLPLPAPATLELLRAARAPLVPSAAKSELVTPTGAAILAALATFEQPALTLQRVGIGAGRRDLPWPNILRLMLGEQNTLQTSHVELQTNIDDMNPQFYAHVMNILFAAGALDVYLTPVQMKKNRPAVRLSVIARQSDERMLAEILLHETTTLGVRVLPLTRYEAEREVLQVATPLGEVAVKIKKMNGRVIQVAPEYDSIVALAGQNHLPLEEVLWQAKEAACAIFRPNPPV